MKKPLRGMWVGQKTLAEKSVPFAHAALRYQILRMLRHSIYTTMSENSDSLRRSGDSDLAKVCLMGASLESGNRGVAALGASLIQLVSSQNQNPAITFLLGRKSSTLFELRRRGQIRRFPVIHFRLTPKAAVKEQLWFILVLAAIYRWIPLAGLRSRIAAHPWFRAILDSDWVGDIRGGDSFSDIYGLKRFLTASLAVISVIWAKGGIVLLPQTYGPFSSVISRMFARYLINHASLLLCRDRDSLEVIESLSRGRRRGEFCPDVAFALDPVLPDTLCTEPPLDFGTGETLIGLNISGLLYNGGYNRNNMFGLKLDYREFLRLLVARLLEESANRILIVPHTFAPPTSVESDSAAGKILKEHLPETLGKRIHLVTADYDQNEIKGVIGQCRFFIGSRMHACIAALSQGIPAVGIAYSKKFHGVFDSVGVSEWVIDGRAVTTPEAVNRCFSLFKERDQLRARLARNVPPAREQLNAVFKRLSNSVDLRSQPRRTEQDTCFETVKSR